jgi:hypothetical protein
MRGIISVLLYGAVLIPGFLRVEADASESHYDPAAQFDPVAAAKADPLFDFTTFKKLMTLTVSVDWNSTDVKAALDKLSEESRRLDPENSGIKFSLNIPADFDSKKYRRQVAMTLTKAPIFSVIEYISDQTNLIPLIHKNELIMVPGVETRRKLDPPDQVQHWEK